MWARHKFTVISKKELTTDKMVFRWDPGPKNKCLDDVKKFDSESVDTHTVPETGEGLTGKQRQGVWDPGLVLKLQAEVLSKLKMPARWMMGLSPILGWSCHMLMTQHMLRLDTRSTEILWGRNEKQRQHLVMSVVCDVLVIESFGPQSWKLKHDEYKVDNLRKFETFRPVWPFNTTAGGDLGTKFSNLRQEQDDQVVQPHAQAPAQPAPGRSPARQVPVQKQQRVPVQDSLQGEHVRVPHHEVSGGRQVQVEVQHHVQDGRDDRQRHHSEQGGQQVQAELQHYVQDDRDDQQWHHSEQEDVTSVTTQILFNEDIEDKVIKSVDRQKDESDSVGLEFVKMKTATREIQHLDTGQMRDELSTLGKVLYKTPDRKLWEQQLEAAMEKKYDEAAMEMKYDKVITMGNMDVMKLLHVDTTENNVVKTRIEMLRQHMTDMKMKKDEAITMRNMEIDSAEDKDYVSELPRHTEKPRPFLGGGRGIIDRDIVWSSSLTQTKCYVAFLQGPEVRYSFAYI
jgi:hypothetical protein